MLLRIVVCAAEATAGRAAVPADRARVGRPRDRRDGGAPVPPAAVAIRRHRQREPDERVRAVGGAGDDDRGDQLGVRAAAGRWRLAGLTALAGLAFLSHVGTLAFLLPTLLILAALYLRGRRPCAAGCPPCACSRPRAWPSRLPSGCTTPISAACTARTSRRRARQSPGRSGWPLRVRRREASAAGAAGQPPSRPQGAASNSA
ncbi:MAG: hypothetical protein MZU84_03990 [Sphingobacterium sp.]|nr:hypothetical protein [Sphingobacterium sp.]